MLTILAGSTISLLLGSPLAASALVANDRYKLLHQPFSSERASTFSDVAVADVDGDGDLDAFAAAFGKNELFLNDGHGFFAEAPGQLPSVDDGARSCLLADVDGDGDSDAVGVKGFKSFFFPDQDQNRLYLNSGSGQFSDATSQLPADEDNSLELAAGDVDGDGDLDLWIGNSSSSDGAKDRLYLNDGTGVYSDASTQIPSVTWTTTEIEFGDVNGDGDLDAILGGAQTNRLLENDGTGNFSDSSANLNLGGRILYNGVLVDLDGDTDLDLIAELDYGDFELYSKLATFINDGTGSFTAAGFPSAEISIGSSYIRSPLAVGDVDRDGDQDVWVGVSGHQYSDLYQGYGLTDFGGQNRLFLNDGSGNLVESTEGLPEVNDSPYAGVFADFDGDSDLDLMIAQVFPNAIQFGDDEGRFTSANPVLPRFTGSSRAVLSGDVNADGHIDLFFARGREGDSLVQHSIWVGDGTGAMEELSGAIPSNVFLAADAAMGDVDGDGDPDLLVAHRVDGDFVSSVQDNRLYLNDGTGIFSDATTQIPTNLGDDRGLSVRVLLEDMDGDSDLDALIANFEDYDGGGGGVEFWQNDGGGGFTEASTALSFFGETGVLAVGDVDGDGDSDVLADSWPYGLRMMLNDGFANFTEAAAQIPAQVLGRNELLLMGDLDGDSDLDLVVGHSDYNTNDVVVQVWKNDGSGNFSDAGATIPQEILSHHLVDIDEDGDLDLISQSLNLLNDGNGNFAEAPVGVGLPYGAEWMEFVDLDRDGDLDSVLANEGTDWVLSNLKTQLAWRSLPRLGRPLTMDLYGPEFSFRVLMAASSRLARPVPSDFGLVHLDPGSIFLVKYGLLDANGEDSYTIHIPSIPGLAGVSIWWQAFVGDPAKLTNLEGTTFMVD